MSEFVTTSESRTVTAHGIFNTIIDHDFREGNVIENMIWCIQNMNVTALEDYEYEVFGYFDNTINFSMTCELLAKILKPDAVSTIFTDKLIDVETGTIITEFDSEKVFEEDFSDYRYEN